jgi:hypothetical protein
LDHRAARATPSPLVDVAMSILFLICAFLAWLDNAAGWVLFWGILAYCSKPRIYTKPLAETR